jgi:hypothetical protein
MSTISAAQVEIRAPPIISIEGLENLSACSGCCCAADQISTIKPRKRMPIAMVVRMAASTICPVILRINSM